MSQESDKALAWARDALEQAVEVITDRGAIKSPLIESRPSWMSAYDVVIGQLRDQGSQTEFLWVIGGTVPADCIHCDLAETARDAARHFALKWQLEAARLEDPEEWKRLNLDSTVNWQQQSELLASKAEFLYELAENNQLW